MTMEEKHGPLFIEDDLSSEQQEELLRYVEEHSEVAKDWKRWQQVRRRLRHRLESQVPDRRLLVLYALEQEGRADLLSPKEQDALDAAHDDIAEAVETVSVLEEIVDRIQEERADFEAVWSQHRDARVEAAAETEERVGAETRDRAPSRPARTRSGGIRPWAWRLTIAALLLGAAVLAVLYGPQQATRTTVSLDAGEEKVVEFGAGSAARLVGAAELSYVVETEISDPKQVTLERGRAYFDVDHREGSTFVVITPTARATVLGTQFAVTSERDTTEVVLVDGRVEVGSADGNGSPSVVLTPGQRSLVERTKRPSDPSPVDVNDALEWTGLFIFRSTPVRTITNRLSDHYDVSISASMELADERVTADFDREQPVSEILQALARTLDAEVKKKDGTFRLEPTA